MKNNLAKTQKTEVVLAKGKSLLGITAKILTGSKALTTAKTHKDVTIIGDLMWENVANPEEHDMNWDDAMEYAKNLRLGGYDDWRLPTIDELTSVVEACGGINVSLDDDDCYVMENINIANESYQTNCEAKGFISYGYWSSTTTAYTHSTSYAWLVHFYNGVSADNGYRWDFYNVRCVR